MERIAEDEIHPPPTLDTTVYEVTHKKKSSCSFVPLVVNRFAGFASLAIVYSVMVFSSGSTIRSLFLDGPAGRLEALLNAGAENATHAAVVCHPHPMFGGTLHNKVVFHTMKALNSFGFPVLRFNFRGAGLSDGEHDRGEGEVEDVRSRP